MEKQANFIEVIIIIFLWLVWKLIHLEKLVSRSLWMMSCCTTGTSETFRWPWEEIILSIRHFESPTEVQLNSWWKTVNLWSITVWYCKLILPKWQLAFFYYLISKFIHLAKKFNDRVLIKCTGESQNSSDCQIALRIVHFVDRTFRGSYWNPAEQLVNNSLWSITGWWYKLIFLKGH